MSKELQEGLSAALRQIGVDVATAVANFATGGGGGSSALYASFYLSTGGLTGQSSTTRTLIINQTDVNSDPSKISLSNNEVTFTDAGDYKIDFSCYFNSAGTARTEYTCWLEISTNNGGSRSTVPGTEAANYARGFDSGDTSAINKIISIPANGKIRFRVDRTDGSGSQGYQNNNGTRLVVEKK